MRPKNKYISISDVKIIFLFPFHKVFFPQFFVTETCIWIRVHQKTWIHIPDSNMDPQHCL
jgi:hypothetical protein